jgi:GxxExxY protein
VPLCRAATGALKFARQVSLPIIYHDVRLECGYRLDVVVEERVLLELKATEKLTPIHEAQMLTYLRMSKLKVGLLINFNHGVLKDRIRRFVL